MSTPTTGRKGPGRARAALVGAAVATVVLGGAAVAQAATSTPSPSASSAAPTAPDGSAAPAPCAAPGPGGPGGRGPGAGRDLHGTLSTFTDGTATLTGPAGGTRTVTVPDDVPVTRDAGPGQEPVAASLGDLVPGVQLRVTTADPAADPLVATAVVVEPTHLDGTVTAVDGTSVTVERRDGSTGTFTTSADTVVTEDGADAETAAITVGDHVHARGEGSGDGFTATAVDLGDPPAPPAPPVDGTRPAPPTEAPATSS